MKKGYVLILINIFCIASVFAQTYNFRVYGEDEGLAQSYVYSLDQARSGHLNVATGEGFCSFDGTKFNNYTVKNNLAENFVTVHFTDSRNVTWLGHYQKGISYLQGTQFGQVTKSNDLSAKLTAFAEDKDHFIWVGTQGKGILCIDEGFLLHQTEVSEAVNALKVDSKNQMLAATTSGLFVYNISSKTYSLSLASSPEFLADRNIQSIAQMDNTGTRYWVGIQDEGVVGIERRGNTYVEIARFSETLRLKGHNYTALYTDQNYDLWISSFGEGLRRLTFNGISEINNPEIARIDHRNGLPNEYILSIFQDYEGNMWFGSFGGGLIELPVERFSFFEEKNGLPDKNIKCLVMRDDHFWIGTSKGLYDYHPGSAAEDSGVAAIRGTEKMVITSLALAPDGFLWIGTEGSGILTYDILKGKLASFSRENKLPLSIVNSIAVTRKGNVIAGTTEGLMIYDLKDKSISHLTTLDGLLHNNITKVFADSKSRIWLCSSGTLPYFIQNNEVTVLNNIPELRSFNVTSIEESADNTIWMCTEGDGVFSYNGKTFQNYKISEGLLSNYCYFIISDPERNIWVAHKNGLSLKPVNVKTFRTFTKSDGLLFSDFNRNSCYAGDKHLWFGTSHGLVRYKCGDAERRLVEPRTSIYSLALNDNTFFPGDAIEVPYNDYALKIDYNSLSFTDPAKITFKYRLVGFDSTWRYTTSRNLEFPKLNDGEYTFELIAGNSDNVWNSRASKVSFIVKPPYWKRVWFYTLLGLVTMTLSYSVIRYRTNSLLIAKQELELRVNEKTALLQQEKETVERIKQELEVKNKNVTDSINYAQRIQSSILPSKKLIFEKFEQAFVYYKPRDIVSGDFYWFTETEENYVIAAVDCTGHGVPGAFMSLVGSTLLNEIVNTKKISSPSAILTRLNKSIMNVLKQHSGSPSAHDGMDMAICTISKNKDKLVFSGALRPLYHFRNGELTEVKGNPYFIGGYFENMSKSFVNTEIALEPGDMIYMFSDGFADQFGQQNKKKFSSRRFKELLREVSVSDIPEQYSTIRNTFLSWKGQEDQVDDILIIGIRF